MSINNLKKKKKKRRRSWNNALKSFKAKAQILYLALKLFLKFKYTVPLRIMLEIQIFLQTANMISVYW